MGRRLGQHFLFDPSILDRIVDALEPRPDDVVLEVGPGKGTLTRRLAPRVARVVAVERDDRLAAEVTALGLPNVTVLAADALAVDWTEAASSPAFKVVGNIPYQITSPLIERALDAVAVPRFVYLMQREVADRVVAAPGTRAYGGLTVGVAVVARAERLFTVRPGAFRPPPRVESTVVRFVRRPSPLLDEPDRAPFRRFVTALFGQRRKTLGRSLRGVLDLPADRARARLDGAGIPPDERVERLAPEALVALYRSAGD